jgi:hypothetical protein
MSKATAAKTKRKPPSPSLPPFLTLNGLAKALQLTPQRVCQLAKDEIIAKPDSRGYYPSSCIGQYCTYARQRQSRSTTSKAVEEGQQIRNELNRAKLRVMKFEEDVRNGQLVRKSMQDAMDAIFRENILGWQATLPPKLEGQPVHLWPLIVRDETRALLTSLWDPLTWTEGNPETLSHTFWRMFKEMEEEIETIDRRERETSGEGADERSTSAAPPAPATK